MIQFLSYSEVIVSEKCSAKQIRMITYLPTSGKYNTTAPSKIKPYGEDIKRLLSEGKTFRQINIYIREIGYTGAESTIRMYATRERKLIREAGGTSSKKLERRWLIKLLYKPIDEIKKFSQEQLDKVIEQYPIIGRLYDVGKNFKELEKWMEECALLDIEEITSFMNGLKRDIQAVKNAIKMGYNNGLAEGSVNKLKVVKRIMYVRNSFELLKAKLLQLELKRKVN